MLVSIISHFLLIRNNSLIAAEEDIEKIGLCIFGLARGSKEVAGKLIPVLRDKIYAEEDAQKIISGIGKIAMESRKLAAKIIEQINPDKLKTPEVRGVIIELKSNGVEDLL